MNNGIGDRFQKETKYSRYSMVGGSLDWRNQPEPYKSYPNSKKIKLEPPKALSNISLDEVLKKRRSIRNFSEKPITKKQLSYLLWASTGIQRKEIGYEFRTAPSAGALYPVETYLIINRVENISKGVYHYSVKDHLLEELKTGDFGINISRAALEQDMCNSSAFVVIWTAIFNRSKWKYAERAYRYIYLDAGHIAENFALASTGLGLGSCQIAALYDDEVNEIIGVDGINESVIYMSVVGNL
ncbi:MAG: hypothetical protein AYK22_00715 [Thermoplasmatales archaeon SG8-52-3]|nr:MAG: hypothetical protein AYK22_00715 [Thermoplasmatales archaeon SG8-52-3]